MYRNATLHPVVAADVFEIWENVHASEPRRADKDVVVVTGALTADGVLPRAKVRTPGYLCVPVYSRSFVFCRLLFVAGTGWDGTPHVVGDGCASGVSSSFACFACDGEIWGVYESDIYPRLMCCGSTALGTSSPPPRPLPSPFAPVVHRWCYGMSDERDTGNEQRPTP